MRQLCRSSARPFPAAVSPTPHQLRLPSSGLCPNSGPVRRQPLCHIIAASEPTSTADPEPSTSASELGAETAVRVGWDPEGLFASAPEPVDWLSRREKKQQPAAQQAQSGPASPQAAAAATAASRGAAAVAEPAAQRLATPPSAQPESSTQTTPAAATPPPPACAQPSSSSSPSFSDPLNPLPAAVVAAGGIPTSSPSPGAAAEAGASTGFDRASLNNTLNSKFMPVNLDHPGVRVLHLDPVVLTIDNFVPPDVCQAWVEAAEQSGCLALSKIGSGNATTSGGPNTYTSRRTSSSMLLDPSTLAAHPALQELLADLHTRAWALLDPEGGGRSWQAVGRMPRAGQYGFESPQVARYMSGQHFDAHEDAFPRMLGRSYGFNRHATLLLYLNHVAEGGATYFDHLGLAVQPKQGRALLFFPSYGDGTPDERTLHTAVDAVDTKYVAQQWIVRGWQTKKTEAARVAAVPAVAPERVVMKVPVKSDEAKATKASGRKKKQGGKGFKK